MTAPSKITELTRLLWVGFSTAILWHFLNEALRQANGLITLPFLLSCLALTIQSIGVLIFSPDSLAKLLAAAGNQALAERLMESSLRIWQKLAGENGVGVASKKVHLAEVYLLGKKETDAEQQFSNVVETWRSSLWHVFSPACRGLAAYAQILLEKDKKLEAQRVNDLIRGSKFGSLLLTGLMVLLVASASFYFLYVRQIESDIARLSTSRRGIGLSGEKLRNAQDLIALLANLKARLFGAGAAAGVYYRYAADAYMPAYDRDIPQTEWAVDRAISYGRLASPDSPALVEPLLLKGQLSFNRGDLDQAENCLKEVLAIIEKSPVDTNVMYQTAMNTADANEWLGRIYQSKRKFELSKSYFLKAIPEYNQLGNSERIDGLLQLSLVERHLSKRGAAKLIDEAADLAEKEYKERLHHGFVTDDFYRRLIGVLVAKQEILRDLGEAQKADAIGKQIVEVESSKSSGLKLDASTQKWIVNTSEDLSRSLLSLRYNAEDKLSARAKLKQWLNNEALDTLNYCPWIPKNINDSSPEISKIEASFFDLCVESKETAGLLAVKIRGNAIFGNDPTLRPFGFYYLIQLDPKRTTEGRVKEFAELLSSRPGSL